MILHSQAPTRVDLAGGTLDIWPLYLFHENSQTINFAINCYARCRLAPRRDKKIELISRDLERRESFPSLDALKKSKRWKLPLLARLVMEFEPSAGLTLETDCGVPAGSGLGGSSALNIAICGALARLTGKKLPPRQLIEVAKNVEAQVLRVPTGEQDYFAAVYGGVQAVHLTPQGVRSEKLPVSARDLASRFVLCYTGESRNSGTNNWEVLKAHLDGNRAVRSHFDRIARIAAEMREAIVRQDWPQSARLLHQDWEARKKNYPGITTLRIERLASLARAHGALAARACGAGGGGCVVFQVEPDAKSSLENVLRREGGRVLAFQVAATGLQVRVSAAPAHL